MPKQYIAPDGTVRYNDPAIYYYTSVAALRAGGGVAIPTGNVALAILAPNPPTAASGCIYGWSPDITTADDGAIYVTPISSFNPQSSQAGSPEGVTTGVVGDINKDTTSLAFYEKTSGSGNTGWTIIPGRWVRMIKTAA